MKKLQKILVVLVIVVVAVVAFGTIQIRNHEGQDTQASQLTEPEPTETETETEEIYEPVIDEITITATGDCTLGPTQTHGYSGSFHDYYDKYGETYFFQGVSGIFSADDCTIVNLECVLTNSQARVEKTWNLKGKPEYVGILTSASIEACSLGNNHTRDYGEVSLTDTQNALNGAGVVYGYNEQVGIYTTKQGYTIGIVSASLLSQSATYENYMQNGITQLKQQGVDIVVACCHWGVERQYYPTEYQVNMAHRLIDCGADLVIGNHPHVLQGVEVYNGKVICYSLGNFCFGGNKNPSDKDTMIFQQKFTFIDGVLQPTIAANIIPCTVSSQTGYNDFQPTVCQEQKKLDIIGDVNKYSASYGVFFDNQGNMTGYRQ